MKLKVKRSPGKICWWIVYNDKLICTAETRKAAKEAASKLSKSVGVPFNE